MPQGSELKRPIDPPARRSAKHDGHHERQPERTQFADGAPVTRGTGRDHGSCQGLRVGSAQGASVGASGSAATGTGLVAATLASGVSQSAALPAAAAFLPAADLPLDDLLAALPAAGLVAFALPVVAVAVPLGVWAVPADVRVGAVVQPRLGEAVGRGCRRGGLGGDASREDAEARREDQRRKQTGHIAAPLATVSRRGSSEECTRNGGADSARLYSRGGASPATDTN